jgi:hypothetical protein
MVHGYEHRHPAGNGANEVSASDVQEAEEAFYEAMALHGHDSAEAFVANHIWNELRKRATNGTSHGKSTIEKGPVASG